jgi:UDP-2,4-diacetamido-2,4,6-trideoxy-beta-L-altropyranose hydrolase
LSSPSAALTLRVAGGDDLELLWRWANDPVARAASFRSRPIEWDEHVAWFDARTRDPASRIYIIEAGGESSGVLRFDLDGPARAVVSINIAPEARGRGLGPDALREGCALVSADDAVSSVTAYIKPDNAASLRTFERSGFVRSGSTMIEGDEAAVLEWTAARVET